MRLDGVEVDYLKAEFLLKQGYYLSCYNVPVDENAARVLFEKWCSEYSDIVPQVWCCLYFLGKSYRDARSFEKAIMYFKASVRSKSEIVFHNKQNEQSAVFYQIAETYNDMKDYDNACEYYRKLMKMHRVKQDFLMYLEIYFVFTLKHEYHNLFDEVEKLTIIEYKKLIKESIKKKRGRSTFWLYETTVMLAILNKHKKDIEQYNYFKKRANERWHKDYDMLSSKELHEFI